MLKRVKVLFFILIFLVIPIFYTIWAGEHGPESGQKIEEQVEQKQKELEDQRKQKAQAETDLNEALQQEKETQAQLDAYGGYTGTLSWGFSKLWSGEYDKLLQQQEDAKDSQYAARKKISDAQTQIENLQKDMAQLSQQYTPTVSAQTLNDLQNQMDMALKNKDLNTFNDNLQQVLAKTPNISDKFAAFTSAIEDVVKEYPNDLTAQSDALKKLELTLNLMLGTDYKLPAYTGALGNITQARESLQAKIDERSPWYNALQKKDISTFRDSLKTLFNQKKTNEDKTILLRDVFNQVSANIAVGSTQWFDALDDIFRYSADIPTEKAGVDLKAELLSSAIDLVNTNLKPDNPDWEKSLNTLYDAYTDPLYYPEIQKRIESELERQKVKTASGDLGNLLKGGNVAEYVVAVEDSVAKLPTTEAKLALINNQYVTAAGELGVDKYPDQVNVLSMLSSTVDPTNFAPIDKQKVQDTFNKINDRLEVIEGRLEAGNNNLGDTLQNAPGDFTRSLILDEELFVTQQLHKDAENPEEVYADQKSFLTEVQKAVEPYKGDIYDITRNDITNRINEIENFKPEPTTSINELDKELNLWSLLPDDQLNVLKQKYNEAIDQLKTALEKNDTVGVKNSQARFQEIKDIIGKYGLAEKEAGFAKNVDAVLDFATTVFEEYEPVEITETEKNVLTKLTAGQTITPEEAALLAGIGTKKVLSFVANNLTPENLASADKVATILEKSTQIANIIGKVMNGIDTAIGAADNWYVKVLLAGPTLVVGPLVKSFLTAKYGEHTVTTIQNVVKTAADKVPDLAEATNSATFQESAAALTTGGKVIKSVSNLLGGIVQNISAAADAKKIENIPQKEVLPTYDAVSAMGRRLDELAGLEPELVVEPENVPVEKKGFFVQIQDHFSNFVADVKKWVTSLFAGDTGIPTLEKKFTAAQEAYKNSPTPATAEVLITAAQNLQSAYQELMGSIASYRELKDLWNNVMMDSDVATALEKDPNAINIETFDQIATKVIQSKEYNAAFMNAMDEINNAVDLASEGTAVQYTYAPLFNKLVRADYITKLSEDRQNMQNLKDAYTKYKANLKAAILKQPTTPAQEEIPQEGVLAE